MELPGVAAASDQAREALGRAHRHRANLRRWPVTAAEAALRSARASAVLDGGGRKLDDQLDAAAASDPVFAGALRVAQALEGGETNLVGVWQRAPAHGELLTLAPFGTADGVVARAVSRLVTIATGLDPHGLGVPEVEWMRRAADYRDAARGFAEGTPEGMAAWLVLSCRAMRVGAQEALSIAETLAEGPAAGGSDE
jgi:hypothetical protein